MVFEMVDDIDAVVARMRAHGTELIGEMQYEDTYRLACALLALGTLGTLGTLLIV